MRVPSAHALTPESGAFHCKVWRTLIQYAEGPVELESALAGLTESNLDLALSDDAWSIRQSAHHLADGGDIWKICIKAALGNSDGLFRLQGYWDKPQIEWSENWRYNQQCHRDYHGTQLFRKDPCISPGTNNAIGERNDLNCEENTKE